MLNPRVGPNQQIMPPANPRMYQGMMQNMMPRQGFNMHGNNNVRGRNNMNRGFQRGGMNRGGRQPHNASHMPQGPPPSMPSNNGNQPQNGMVPPAVAPPQQPRHGMVPPPQQPNPMMISGQEMQNHQ